MKDNDDMKDDDGMKDNDDVHMHSVDDIHDNSPKNLQGASQTSGGILHGRAQGNIFNLADVKDVLEQGPGHGVALRGRVYVFSSPLNPTTLDPEVMKPMATIKVVTLETIAPMLQQVSCQFSPVHSKYTTLYVKMLILIFVLENNHHIYVLENSVWDLKGRFNMVVKDDDDIDWVKVKGEDAVSVLVVSSYLC